MENYSGSKCPKCEKHFFEMVEETPSKSKFKLQFIRCFSCKTVIGVMDYFNIGASLDVIQTKLDSIEAKTK